MNLNKLISILLVIGLVIIANIASLYLFTRFDFTENHIYSISNPSKKILGELNDRLTIKAYFSKDMPAPYNSVSQFVRDLLEEYKAYGKGNVYFEYINPGDDKKLEEEATSFRVPPLQVNALENDKIEIKKVYMGLVFLYQDKKEVLPVISKTAGLEYDITGAIKRLIVNKKQSIGIIQGHREPAMNEKLQTMYSILQKQYEVRELNLPQLNSIPSEIGISLLIAPQDTFSMEDLYKIDQFIMRGGKMGFMMNEHAADIGRGIAFPLYHKLSPFLENFGIKINNDMVMDAQCIPIN
ncbi:MAG: GldG family protein, partial [Candidatus Delongbacteria bacterium]|nr:GldG family protein [Candidatus Delongbacteria bacterium]